MDITLHRGAGAYICGEETGAAELARGQARLAAAQAAVPGGEGPVRQPDGRQQRRDADERPVHHREGRRVVRRPRHGQVGRHAHRLRVGPRREAGRLRAADGHLVHAQLIDDVCGGVWKGRRSRA